ncbi:MAG: hypothetical protein Q9168_003455 [Polycauliona sp. 1 TL-2023]
MAKTMTDRERFPDYFVEEDIDRRKCTRVVPMKVLVIGMLRTGTLSMQSALEELGYKSTHHMHKVFQNPGSECVMWREAFEAKYRNKGKRFTRKEWDQLLGHCQADVDLPAAAFIPELYEAYPEAKVVVVQRDPSRWFESCSRTVMKFSSSPQLKILYFLDRWLAMRLAPFMGLMMTSLFGPKTEDPVKKRENWIGGYMAVYDEVRRIVPPEKRLEFSLDQGWEPLCEFLEKDVPKKPFPHVNDSPSFDAGIKVMVKRMWIRAAKQNLPIVVGVFGIAAAWWIYG